MCVRACVSGFSSGASVASGESRVMGWRNVHGPRRFTWVEGSEGRKERKKDGKKIGVAPLRAPLACLLACLCLSACPFFPGCRTCRRGGGKISVSVCVCVCVCVCAVLLPRLLRPRFFSVGANSLVWILRRCTYSTRQLPFPPLNVNLSLAAMPCWYRGGRF